MKSRKLSEDNFGKNTKICKWRCKKTRKKDRKEWNKWSSGWRKEKKNKDKECISNLQNTQNMKVMRILNFHAKNPRKKKTKKDCLRHCFSTSQSLFQWFIFVFN